MARRNSIVRDVTLLESATVTLTDAERKSEWLRIVSRITNRPPQVGTFNVEPTIPRQWSGWYWVVKDSVVVDSGAIQFENQLILENRELWLAEVITNTYSLEATTPDTEVEELIDENSVLGYFSNELDADNYYLPFPHPYDEVRFWFPPGVTLNVVVEHTPWSDISVFGEDNDIDVTEFIQERETLGQPDLGTNTSLPLDGVCETAFPGNWVNPEGTTYRVYYESSNAIDNFARTARFESRTPPGIVGAVESGSSNFPATTFIPATTTPLPCSELPVETPRNIGPFPDASWARVRIESSEGQFFIVQTTGQQNGQATIDFSSIRFERC